MNCDHWIDLLYSDPTLTSELPPEEAEELKSWSESHLSTCQSEVEAERLFANLRLVNRYVAEGESFDQIFTALRANTLRSETNSPLSIHPDELGPEIDNIYPSQIEGAGSGEQEPG